MANPRRPRVSIRSLLAGVVAAAIASGLFARVRTTLAGPNSDGWDVDVPALLIIAIALTAAAVALVRRHTLVQFSTQVGLSCLICLSWVELAEAHPAAWADRLIRYWFQIWFALTIVVPLAAVRWSDPQAAGTPRGIWWRGFLESVMASFLIIGLVGIGYLLQFLAVQFADGL